MLLAEFMADFLLADVDIVTLKVVTERLETPCHMDLVAEVSSSPPRWLAAVQR